jgi:hypothetical protein
MKFTVFHIHHKPIEPKHRVLFMQEWREYATNLLAIKPEKSDTEAWQEINNKLNGKEDELKEKFPCRAVWNLNSFQELGHKLEKYGTVSICKENDNYVIYIADLESDREFYGQANTTETSEGNSDSQKKNKDET